MNNKKDYKFYYSREDRLKRTKRIFDDNESKKLKGFDKLFAGNKIVKIFFFVYILIIFFVFTFQFFLKRNIYINKDLMIKYKIINNNYKNGLYLEIKNIYHNYYYLSNIIIYYKSLIFKTNINIELEKNDFDIIFIPIEFKDKIIDERKIKITINREDNNGF